jgi:hypothetical protein
VWRRVFVCGAAISLAGLAAASYVASLPSHDVALPPRECTEGCDALVWFAPPRGPGYEVVALEDEDALPDSMSYIRRDLMMAIKYATAKVARTAGGRPLGLGDMSDRDGATPGTAYGQPRHPRHTHTAGRDADVAYYQRGTPDNHLAPICPHAIDGFEQWHCTGPPTTLDARRTALFIGFLFESPRVRIVGIDGAAAGPIWHAIHRVCANGTVPADACARIRIGYETANTGRFWYFGHHNHMHVSWSR